MNSSKPIGFRTKSKSETSEQTKQREFLNDFPLSGTYANMSHYHPVLYGIVVQRNSFSIYLL